MRIKDMDDIKYKFLELINKQQESQEKIPIVQSKSELDQTFQILPDNIDKNDTLKEKNENFDTEMISDLDVLDSIEDVYFAENSCDLPRYELMKLCGSLEMDSIENKLHKLQAQLAVVSKRVLHMILQNQPACQHEFDKMNELHNCLESGLKSCRNARSHLGMAQKSFTTMSLGILTNYRKRKITLQLLRSLNTIKTLLQTETRLEESLADGNFSEAISILLECQQVAYTYRHFYCVAALIGKLQDTLVMAEEQLDVALAKISFKFDDDIYSKLQSAYLQLGKRRIAMDQLHMHFTSSIHSSAFNVIHQYAVHENIARSKKPYSQLCKNVISEKLIDCLIQLCQSFWHILRSYNQVIRWHTENQYKYTDGNDFEQNIDEQYIKQKLEAGVNKLWHDIQSRVSLLITSSDVSHFKFDEFLHFLSILHKLVQVGEEFCGSDSAELQSSIKGQSSNFFRKYHLSRLGELRLFLENEAWAPCPVKNNFNLLHLQEFRNLRYVVQNASLKKSHKKSDSVDQISSGSSGYFSRYIDSNTPFDTCSEFDTSLSLDEDILLSQNGNSGYGTEESEEEENDKTDEKNCNMNQLNRHVIGCENNMLLTNTTLTVLRYCGKYLQMSRLLSCISSDVIICLRQLFEYYFYAVCTFFSVDLPDVTSSNVLYCIHKLKAVLKRIEDNLLQFPENDENSDKKVLAPCISPMVDLTDPEQLFGLAERIVGVESLVLLAEQFTLLRDYLEHLITNEDDKHALYSFYSQVVQASVEVRKPVYECVARKIIDSKTILNLMSKVNWEVQDVMCQHSQYVDVLLREIQIFVTRLDNIGSLVTIPSSVLNSLWQSISEFLAEIFVEGFSNARKCSNGGRALMQLDYTQLMTKLEVLSTLKPIPKRDFVETYVKAYYLTESTLQTWITEHSEYTTKQMIALVNCTCSNNKKARQKLTALIEEMERR